MEFFFPDSHDLVDPTFDFLTEKRSPLRVRHQHDLYAHELFKEPPYSGILVSKAIVDGTESGAGKYTTAQRQRLLRVGVREFFRFGDRPLLAMGDCGAFSYVRHKVPPYSVEDVMRFYTECDFDFGISVDHVILGFHDSSTKESSIPADTLAEYRERQNLTLELARDFFKCHKQCRPRFSAMGVAQGWSPESYAKCVRTLQKIGYTYIALGGMVPLKTDEILSCLEQIQPVRRSSTRLHLLGVNRCEHLRGFQKFGVVSFDSTSPLLQAFKHDRENYYTREFKYSAIRVPQVEGNARFSAQIRAGQVKQEHARKLEQACLKGLLRYDVRNRGLSSLVGLLREYDLVHDGRKDRSDAYRKTLGDKPWKRCKCSVCRELGIHVVIFRGAERNRRRGFHNLYVTYQQFHKSLKRAAQKAAL